MCFVVPCVLCDIWFVLVFGVDVACGAWVIGGGVWRWWLWLALVFGVGAGVWCWY